MRLKRQSEKIDDKQNSNGIRPKASGAAVLALLFMVLTGLCLGVTSADAATLRVGTGQDYSSPCEASGDLEDGDTLLIAAELYENQACNVSADNVVLKGQERYAHLTPPETISNGKAIWVIQGDDVVVENIEFSEASVPDQNGAGIRAEGRNLTIRHCYFHDNENGILGGGGTVRIEYSEFAHNGYGDGYSHNLYIGQVDSLVFRFNHSHHARIGHELKSRAAVNLILYNRIMNEADGTASYTIDLPNGGTSVILGNLLQQGPESDNSNMIHYGGEGLVHEGKDLFLSHNTFVNDRGSGNFLSAASGGTCLAVNNVFIGSGGLGGCEESGNADAESGDLRDAAGYDYRPVEGAAFLNSGVDPGEARDFSLTPVFQYEHPASGHQRPVDGSLDAGAYEWESGTGVAVPAFGGGRLRAFPYAARDLSGRLRWRQRGPAVFFIPDGITYIGSEEPAAAGKKQ